MLYLNGCLNRISGKWYSHQTVYFVSKKLVKNYKIDNQIIINLKQINDDMFKNKLEIESNNTHSDYAIINRNQYNVTLSTMHTSDYQLCLLNKNCIKVLSTCGVNNINYIEYIYSMNKNFRISIIFLKHINQYLAVAFASYIKQIR